MKSISFKLLIILLAAFLCTYLIGRLYSKSKIADEYLETINNGENIFDTGISQNEILLVYVMDYDCIYSNNEEIIKYINELVYNLKSTSLTKNYSVKFLLSTTNNPYASSSLLSKFNSVDETNFGNRWNSQSINKFLMKRGFTTKSTPQLLVVKRENHIEYHGSDPINTTFDNEKVILQLRSFPEIINFSYQKVLLIIDENIS